MGESMISCSPRHFSRSLIVTEFSFVGPETDDESSPDKVVFLMRTENAVSSCSVAKFFVLKLFFFKNKKLLCFQAFFIA